MQSSSSTEEHLLEEESQLQRGSMDSSCTITSSLSCRHHRFDSSTNTTMAKSKTQDAVNDHATSSMRRLSSFASIHSLLSFTKNRRLTSGTEESLLSDADPASLTPSRALKEKSHNARPYAAAFGGLKQSTRTTQNAALPRSKTFSSIPTMVKNQKRVSAVEESHTLSTDRPTAHRRHLPFTTPTTLVRSDTEPLLNGTALANKENVTPQNRGYLTLLDSEKRKSSLPRHPSFSGKLPQSSPRLASKPYRQLPDTSQRWKSQPDLFFTPVRAPTPPPCTRLPLFTFETPSRLSRLDEVVAEASNTRAITEAQSIDYWTARLSSLLDRAKTRDMQAWHAKNKLTYKAETDVLVDKTCKESYIRKAMVELYAQCTTVASRESFVSFQMQYAALTNQPRLTIAIEEGQSVSSTSTVRKRHTSSGRRFGFVDKLIDRVKRRSIT